MKGVADIAYNLKQKYDEEYRIWRNSNPSKIMHGSWSKSDAMNYGKFCSDVRDIDCLIKVYDGMHKEATTINSFKFFRDAFIELKEEVIKEAEKEYFL